MAGNLAGLTASQHREAKYVIGGVAAALGVNTFTSQKLNQVTFNSSGVMTVAQAAVIVSVDPEENTLGYSDDTKIGNNRYPEHTLMLKLGGRNAALNTMAQTFDLVRTTWFLKTKSGECLVLGAQNGLVSSQNKSGAGAGPDDFNGYDVILLGGETTKAQIITTAEFDALAALAV